MSDDLWIWVVILIIGSALPVFGWRVRNARGIFIAFMIVGAFAPALSAVVFRQRSNTGVYALTGAEGSQAIIGCVIGFFVVVYASIYLERWRKMPRGMCIALDNTSSARFFAVCSLAMSICYIVLIAIRLGGFTSMLARLYGRVSLNDSVANYLSIVYFGAFVFAVFGFFMSRISKSYCTKRCAELAVLICGLVTILLGGRSIIIFFVLALAYIPLIKMGPIRFFIVSSFGLAAIFVLSYAVLMARYTTQGAVILMGESSTVDYATTGLSFVDAFAAAVAYADKYGFDFGQLYLNTLVLPIPRDLWAAKPLQISIEMRSFLFGDTTGGVPPGLFGEAYIAFGQIGVIVAGVVLAWLIARINGVSATAVRTGCPARTAIAGTLAPLIPYALVRGGFDIGVLRVGLPAFWCLVAFAIAKRGAFKTTVRTGNGTHAPLVSFGARPSA